MVRVKAFVPAQGAIPRTMLLGAMLLGASRFALGDDFWKRKPAKEWSSAEALKLVRHSPWAKVEVVVFLRTGDEAAYSIVTGARYCDTDAVDPSGACLQKGRIEAPVDSSRQPDASPQLSPSTAFLVRWESAAPIIQAFARLQDLGQRQAAAFQSPAPRHPPDRYVITVKVDNPGFKGFEPFAMTPADRPKLSATLKTRTGSVPSVEVEFSGVGASSAVHFFFPRAINGVALLDAGRNSAEFSLLGAGFAVHSKFTIDAADQ